jgi:hypothetical protein
MTLEWRALASGEVDHEKLWTLVIGASAVIALATGQFADLPPFRCVFKAVTGLPCLTCGCARGLIALLDGDLVAAARWNPLVPLGAIAALGYGPYAAMVAFTRLPRLRVRISHSDKRLARWVVLVSCAFLWSWLYIDGR